MPAETEQKAVPVAGAVVVSLYIAAQMLADVASLKIGLVAGLSVDMGTFIYPFTFTLRDVVHKTLGKKTARAVVFTAGAVNLVMASYLLLAAWAPEDPAWGRGAEFHAIFFPVWRIVLASIVAELAGELVDTEVYDWFVHRVTRAHKWLRVLVSNSVSLPLDSLLFSLGAFAFALPWEAVRDIFLVNVLVKFGATILGLPLIYIGRERDE